MLSRNITFDPEGLNIFLDELKDELSLIEQDLKSEEFQQFTNFISNLAIGVSNKLSVLSKSVREFNTSLPHFQTFYY